MEHKIVILCGKSGSGKSLVSNKLTKNGFRNIVTSTTRPPREGEKDGVDYCFLSDMEFKTRIADGEMVEYHKYNTEFGTWYYGSSSSDIDLTKHDYVIVLTLEGAKAYINYFGAENCIVFYIDAPKSVRERRAKQRGSFNQSEWDRRVKADNIDFSQDKVAHVCNFKISNYNKSIYNLIKEIKEDIRLWKNNG